jgi:hypothetical protein
MPRRPTKPLKPRPRFLRNSASGSTHRSTTTRISYSANPDWKVIRRLRWAGHQAGPRCRSDPA